MPSTTAYEAYGVLSDALTCHACSFNLTCTLVRLIFILLIVNTTSHPLWDTADLPQADHALPLGIESMRCRYDVGLSCMWVRSTCCRVMCGVVDWVCV